jgi:hypothetical protein
MYSKARRLLRDADLAASLETHDAMRMLEIFENMECHASAEGRD